MEDVAWLESWFARAAPGWQHGHAIEIRSLLEDDPGGGAPLGWQVTISLHGTAAERRSLEPVEVRRRRDDYVVCSLYRWPDEQGGMRFEGYCGPRNLGETLQIFRDWIESDRSV